MDLNQEQKEAIDSIVRERKIKALGKQLNAKKQERDIAIEQSKVDIMEQFRPELDALENQINVL